MCNRTKMADRDKEIKQVNDKLNSPHCCYEFLFLTNVLFSFTNLSLPPCHFSITIYQLSLKRLPADVSDLKAYQ